MANKDLVEHNGPVGLDANESSEEGEIATAPHQAGSLEIEEGGPSDIEVLELGVAAQQGGSAACEPEDISDGDPTMQRLSWQTLSTSQAAVSISLGRS